MNTRKTHEKNKTKHAEKRMKVGSSGSMTSFGVCGGNY